MCGKIKLMLTVFFAILLASCTNQPQGDKSTANNLDVIVDVEKENNNEQLIADLPIKLDSLSDYIVFQIKAAGNQSDNKVSYNSRKGYSDNYLRNLIFQNTQTEQTNVLTINKIKIISYEQLYNAKNQTEKVILYQVIDTFNEDEETLTLTSLYLSINDGKNFKKISPKDHHLNSWKYFPELKKVFFKTTEDSDGNNILNNLDKQYIYSVSIEDFKAKELLTNEIKTITN